MKLKFKRISLITIGVALSGAITILIFYHYLFKPAGYKEIENYDNTSGCLANIPECGVCEEEYGGYKLINGKCYGKE